MLCFVMAGFSDRFDKNMLKNTGFAFFVSCGFCGYFRIVKPFGLVFVGFDMSPVWDFAVFACRDET